MIRSTRDNKTKLFAAGAITAMSLGLFGGVAGAQAAVTVIDEGSSDELVAPPSPTCGAGQLELIPETAFSTIAEPIGVPRLGVGAGLSTEFDIPDFDAIEPGVIDVVEIITFDAHTGRSGWPTQDNESVAVEFLLDGEVQVTTEFTPDVEDGVNAAWVVADLGQYDLPEGADAARIVHFNEADNSDSVVAASLCIEFSDVEIEVAEEDRPDVALQDGEEPEFTLEELLAQNAEGADGDELALTGANEIAFAVIALGVMVLGVAAKVQGKDPEDFKY